MPWWSWTLLAWACLATAAALWIGAAAQYLKRARSRGLECPASDDEPTLPRTLEQHSAG